jgi:hypothetical protein
MAQIKKSVKATGTKKAKVTVKQKKLIKTPKTYTCADCLGKSDKRFTHKNTDGYAVCNKCGAKYFECVDCRGIRIKRRSRTIEYEGKKKVLCHYCKGDYGTCQDCDDGIMHHRRDLYGVDSGARYVCRPCRSENYERCANCDALWLMDNMFYENDGGYCPRCYHHERRRRLIKNYSYTPPRWNFLDLNKRRKIHRNTTYAGIELEVDCEDLLETAEKVKSEFKSHTLFKEDGSIDGFEIVTHPQTLVYMKQKFDWKKKLKVLADAGCTSYDGGKCGIHVTVNKSALSDFQWWKFSMFFDVCKVQIKKFSKRNNDQISQWCNFPKDRIGAREEDRQRMKMKRGQHNYTDKYNAINFKSNRSVEIRIFRGTLNYERFWASILFVYALMDFVRIHGYGYMNKVKNGKELWEIFGKWAETNPVYDMLTKYFEERKQKALEREKAREKALKKKKKKAKATKMKPEERRIDINWDTTTTSDDPLF